MDRYSGKNGQRQFCEHYFSFMNRNIHLWLEWWTPEGWADSKNQRKVVVSIPNRTGIDMVFIHRNDFINSWSISCVEKNTPTSISSNRNSCTWIRCAKVPLLNCCFHLSQKSPIVRAELFLLFVLKLPCHASSSTVVVVVVVVCSPSTICVKCPLLVMWLTVAVKLNCLKPSDKYCLLVFWFS